MRRREFAGTCAGTALAAAFPVLAGPQAKPKRVAIHWVSWDQPRPPAERREYESRFEAQGLRLGRDVMVQWYETVYRKNADSTVTDAAAAIVKANPDVVIGGDLLVFAMLKLGSTIPMVVNLGDADPVDLGLARSIARPGGHITGIYAAPYETNLKRLQVLRQFQPDLSGVAWIAFGPQLAWFPTFERAARSAGLLVEKIVPEWSERPRFDRVRREIGELRRKGCAAAHFTSSMDGLVEAVASAALDARVLVSYGGSEERLATEGLLFMYQATMEAPGYVNAGRLVPIAARLVRGERPGDIAFEGPIASNLVVNRKTAARLGVAIPPDVLLLANAVID
jgi:putative ABC transport system substrate-binding protein